MAPRLKSLLRIVVSILFAIALLYLAFRGSDLEKLVASLRGANYFWVVVIVPLLLISHFFRAWRWKYLLGPVKHKVSIRNLFSSLMIGYMVNYALPRVGEVVRAYNLGRTESIPKSSVFGTVLIERIIDVLSLFLFLPLVLIFYRRKFGEVFPWLEDASIVVGLSTLFVLGLCVYLIFHRDRAFRVVRKVTGLLPSSMAPKFERILHSFLDGFLIIKEPRRYTIVFILSTLIWFAYVLMVFLPFYAFGLTENYSMGFGAAIVTLLIATIGIIIPAPGGTGSYHWLVRETLVGFYGVELEIALSYATITHLVGLLTTVVVGFFYFLRDNLKVADIGKGRNLDGETVHVVASQEEKVS